MTDLNRDADRHHYRTDTTYRGAADRSEDESVSRRIVEAVAAHEDVKETELPALAEFVDPDALDSLFGPRFDGGQRGSQGRVEFRYAGYRVTVEIDGTFTVRSVAGGE